MSCFNRGRIDETFLTTELKRQLHNMTWRVGINQWHYFADYASNTTMYDHNVQTMPEMLYHPEQLAEKHYYGNTPYYNLTRMPRNTTADTRTNWRSMPHTIGTSRRSSMCTMVPDWNGIAQARAIQLRPELAAPAKPVKKPAKPEPSLLP